jgi:hypothetical protein
VARSREADVSKYGPSFTATATRKLRRRGLRGDTITVVLAGDLGV